MHHKFKDNFGPNSSEYYKRFYGNPQHVRLPLAVTLFLLGNPDHLKNLFFIYLIELRALYKSEPYLLDKIKWNVIGDKVQARDAIKALLSTKR